MTFKTFTSGIDTSFSSELNTNFNSVLRTGQENPLFKTDILISYNWKEIPLATGTITSYVPVAGFTISEIRSSGTYQTNTFGLNQSISNAVVLPQYIVYSTYDNFRDSSVNASRWTTTVAGNGSIGEDTTQQTIAVGAGAQNSTGTAKSTSTDLSAFKTIVFEFNAYCWGRAVNGEGESQYLAFTDGTNFSYIINSNVTDSQYQYFPYAGFVICYNDTANKKLIIMKNNLKTAVLDYSAWSSLKLESYCYGRTSSVGAYGASYINMYFVGLNNNGTVNSTFTETVTANGSTFESLTVPHISLANSGQLFAYKNVLTLSSEDIILLKDFKMAGW